MGVCQTLSPSSKNGKGSERQTTFDSRKQKVLMFFPSIIGEKFLNRVGRMTPSEGGIHLGVIGLRNGFKGR